MKFFVFKNFASQETFVVLIFCIFSDSVVSLFEQLDREMFRLRIRMIQMISSDVVVGDAGDAASRKFI